MYTTVKNIKNYAVILRLVSDVFAMLMLMFLTKFYALISRVRGDRGSTVVKVLCYKSEGRWFEPSWCQ